jgi:cardiolipin synthase
MILKYIPNLLTFIRIGLIIPFVMCLLNKAYTDAFNLFVIAGLTDALDGLIARHFNWQTFLGSFIDPAADKLLVATSFISLAIIGSLPWWLVALVFLRDLTISIGVVICYWFIQRHILFHASWLSKVNTTLQLVLVTVCLFELAYFQFSNLLVTSLIYITALTTGITFIQYIKTGIEKTWPHNEQPQ